MIFRAARWPDDIAALSALDTALETECIYRPVREALSFRLTEKIVSPPLRKRYAFNPSDLQERRNWDYAVIAEQEGNLAGFAAAQYVEWNRRVILWHLYVAPNFRRQGVGTGLLGAVETFAQSKGARCLWLETQNVNYSAIQFYRNSGFHFCGFDESLYDPETVSNKEIALFFSRPVSAPHA